ncbi:hypothetical protein N752_00865 [Desulforamulus aquiferis]|nr:hypothetical protein N752_00865 [Desulforamulus aquiferis]
MQKKSVKDIDVKGKRVFVRVDFNVPLDGDKISDDTRIQKALPTIKYLMEQDARVILASHLGRPKGEVVEKYRLTPVAKRLSELLGKDVVMARDSIGPDTKQLVEAMGAGDVLLLENVRFHSEETKNDEKYARQLAELADVFVNDAFGAAHRAHASTTGVAEVLPGVAGFLMEKELEMLGKVVTSPDHPFVAIIGGAKVSDKIGVIENLLSKVDVLIIGGGMANTFIRARALVLASLSWSRTRWSWPRILLTGPGNKRLNCCCPLMRWWPWPWSQRPSRRLFLLMKYPRIGWFWILGRNQQSNLRLLSARLQRLFGTVPWASLKWSLCQGN